MVIKQTTCMFFFSESDTTHSTMRKKFTYLWLNEYSTTTFTEPETAQIGLNKKKKRGLCLRNGCNENVDFNHVSPDYMYVKRVACGDKPTDNYPLKSAVYVSSTLTAVAASLLNAASGRLHKGAFRRRGWRRTKQSWKRTERSWPQVERSTSPNEF